MDGTPAIIPTIHARIDDTLYFHGLPANRTLSAMRGGAEVCVSATIVDGLVLARSAFHHSMNYRSVVVYGTPRLVSDRAEKLRALEAVTEHVARGRWAEVRQPNEREIRTTHVLALPFATESLEPVADAGSAALPIPLSVSGYRRIR